jgi:Family of unknown function (DUF5677)
MNNVVQKLSFIRDQYIDEVIGKIIFPSVKNIPQANNPIAVVSDFFLHKATKTLDAICILSEAGFAKDALILGRTIFELGLHLQTISSADSIEQRQHKALCFIYDGERQRKDKLKKFAELKSQGKCLSWINEIESSNPVSESMTMPQDFVQPKSNLKDMASDLSSDPNGKEWECWYHFIYWSLSNLIHPSGLGSHTYIQDCDQEEEASRAITVALTMHYFLTKCMLNMLELDNLRPQLDECVKEFISLSNS